MNVKINCVTQPLVSRLTEEEKEHLEDSFGSINLTPEEYIIHCARVSNPENRLNNDTAPKLLNYLIDHKHWSPFEMVSIGIEIQTSRAIAQQIIRHRSFSFQEFSQRYAEVTDFEKVELRMKAEKNRQSSEDVISEKDENYIDLNRTVLRSFDCYDRMIANGVAKETARMVLPLCTSTTIVMHGTLRSWIHFFDQRCDAHAQKEIQEIAYKARNLMSIHFPWTAAALEWK